MWQRWGFRRRAWWLWSCMAGAGLGLIGVEYCRRRRAVRIEHDDLPWWWQLPVAPLVAALPPGQPMPQHLRDSRWLLEEYRVSLWAQQLGTREKVSDQRIRKVLGTSV